MASTAEAEVWGLFWNGKTDVPLYITINELGFRKPSTPIKTYNLSAKVIVAATVQGNGYAILLDEGQG